MGEQYIGLDPGGDPDNLAAGDRITNTQSAVILENLIGQFLFSKAADSSNASGAAPAPAAAGTTPASSSGAALPSPSLAVPSLSTPSAPAKDPKNECHPKDAAKGLASALALAVLLSGCATTNTADPRDPLEGLNRATFQFNDTLDKYALSRSHAVTPTSASTGA